MAREVKHSRQAAVWAPIILCMPAIAYIVGVLTEWLAMTRHVKLRPTLLWQWMGVAVLAAGCVSPITLGVATGFMIWGVRTGRLAGARLLLVAFVFIIAAISCLHVFRNVLYLGQRWG